MLSRYRRPLIKQTYSVYLELPTGRRAKWHLSTGYPLSSDAWRYIYSHLPFWSSCILYPEYPRSIANHRRLPSARNDLCTAGCVQGRPEPQTSRRPRNEPPTPSSTPTSGDFNFHSDFDDSLFIIPLTDARCDLA